MSSIRNKTDSTTQKFQFYGGLVSRGIIILLTRFKGIQGHCTACTGYSESLLYKSCWVFGIRPTAHNKLDEMFVCGVNQVSEQVPTGASRCTCCIKISVSIFHINLNSTILNRLQKVSNLNTKQLF